MRKAITIALALATMLGSCGKSGHRDLDRLLVELAGNDATIDTRDWNAIEKLVEGDSDTYADFLKHGKMDEETLREYITNFFASRRPPKDISFAKTGAAQPSFRLYLERSGSMMPYDSRDGDGSYHAAIMAIENAIPGTIRPDTVGEKGYTDFRKIFDDLLNNTPEGRVSILATDLIYSVRDMQGVNPQKVFAEMQQMTDAVFKSGAQRKAMLVVRMSGSYNGPYYSYDNTVTRYDGRRPWYIIITGSEDNMRSLTTDASLRTFARLESLRGYEGMCLFTRDDIYEPYTSFLLSNADAEGRFRPEKGQGTQILSLTDVEPDRKSGKLRLALAVDLGNMLIDSKYLADKANYEVSASGSVSIEAIRPITKADLTPAEKKYAGTATHIMVLDVKDAVKDDEVHIRLLNRLPRWATSGSTDNDLRPDSRTTFGLRYLMQGIYDSYARNNDSKPAYFDIELEIKR